MINFSSEPYNDDFDENNKFHRILFRPSYAVQARELTQLQTILQNQIKRNGDHIFKQGAMVIPGQISLDTKYQYVKIQSTFGSKAVDTYISKFEGTIITGSTSGVTALVLKAETASGTDPTTLYVRYTNSGTNGTTKVFTNAEAITSTVGGVVVGGVVNVQTSSATGTGSAAIIERGVYYVNGYYVLCDDQTLLLDKYTSIPTYRVGLTIDEQKVTPEDNETLLDNAQTSFNYAAPGAHRYFIDLILSKLSIGSTLDDNFIELLRVTEGIITKQITSTGYSELEKTLARRTFDESGDYTVSDFTIDVREHRNNNRGQWVASTAYLIGDVVTNAGYTYVAKNSVSSITTAPTHTSGSAYDGAGVTGVYWLYDELPFYNRGVYLAGNATKLAIGLEPGKAYIQGYEVEKVAKEYVEIDKARDYVQVDNAVIPATVGNYVLVNNLNNLPKFDTFETVDLYDRITNASVVSLVGTLAFSSASASVTGTTTAFTTELTVGSNLYLASSDVYLGTILSIASDTALTLTANATATVSPAAACKRDGRGTAVGTKIGTCRVRGIEWDTGTIGDVAAIYKLSIFDTIMVAGYDFNRDVKSFYYSGGSAALSFTANISPITTQLIGTYTFSTTTITGQGTSFQTDLSVGDYIYLGLDLRRVVTLTAQQTLTVDVAPTATGLTIKLVKTAVYEPQNSGLIFPFPYYAIKSTRSVTNTNNTTYTVTERFTSKTSNGTVSINTTKGLFASYADSDNYLFTNEATGNIVKETNITGTGTGTITVTIAAGTYTVQAAINRSGSSSTEKTKTTTPATVTFLTLATATNKILSLGKADLIKITSIKMKSGSFASPGATYSIDIRDRFTVDNGHRDSYYDVARLNLIPSFNPPEAPIEVVFEYFDHGSEGDYFTVNSYSDVRYEDIPPGLRDSIDFRPRIADAGVLFSGTGALTTLMPKRGIDIRSDFQYYLARRDNIVLNFAGTFSSVVGVSALNPGVPENPSLSMVLYNLSLEPYTFSTGVGSVRVNKIDNKRYTMRDIGKLEKRIDNLEYYTSLSLLEQQTESMELTDSAGLSRFKNGFIVDSFTGHGVGDTTSLDYLCSVDAENAELRPFFAMDNVNLIEKNTSDAGRAEDDYKLYGDVITLPVLDHIKLVEQKYASRLENINPFAVFTFLGDVKINPSSDEWFEVTRRPDIIQEVEGNYNLMYTIAQRAGVLGTVWNAWQNVWAGTPIRTSSDTYTQNAGRDFLNGLGGNWHSTGNWSLRSMVVDTFATQVGQSRTGIKTSLVAKIDTRITQDRVLSTAVIPYIRSRNVLIQIRGLKPATRFYPYFDGVDIASYCTPSTKLTYTVTTGTFNVDQNVGGSAAESYRMINGDSQVCLNKGDIVFVSNRGGAYSISGSPATAVVVGKDYNGTSGIRTLHLANIKGTFLTSDTIQGSVSGAIGTVVTTPTVATIGQSLVTNFAGEISLLFNIPNTEAHRFRTGNKEFKMIDVSTVDGAYTSRGRTQYNAVGILETKQATVQATRNAELVNERVSATQTIVQTGSRVVSDTGWYDPLAQTFLIDSPGGAFITKIDVFFASKDTQIPVTMELREVVNGYPGKRVLPFSRVSLNPENVNISSSSVTIIDKATGISEEVPKYDTATTFTFPSPVFVQDKEEYCLVLLSDSNNYKVWISNMGDVIPDSSQTISEQPYNGVLFKSQNASTWTANQDQDLKFTIYRAQFDTSVIGNVEFVNDVLPHDTLDVDPIEVKSGSSIVRVWHMNHGMPSGSTVQLTNLTTTKVTGAGTITCGTGSTAVTGVSTVFNTSIGTTTVGAGTILYNSAGVLIGVVASVTDNLNLVLVANAAVAVTGGAYKINSLAGISGGQYISKVIGNVDLDSYTITTTTTANTTGYFGGDTVRATKNVQYDAFYPMVQSQLFTETQANYLIKMTSGKSVDGSQTDYTLGSFVGCLANETNTLYTPSMVASGINETSSMTGNKSLSFSAQISSTNDALSPIIDTHRLSLIAISNKVNSPSEANMNVAAIDTTALFTGATGAFSFSGSTITSTNATVRNLIKTFQIGKYITVSASTTAGNDGTYLVTGNVDGSNTGAGLVTTTLISPTVTGNGSTVFLSSIGSGTTGAGTILYNSTGIVIGVVASVASDNVLTLVGNAAVALTTGAYKITSTTATISNKTFTGEAGAAGTTISVRKMFVDEIAPVGSSTHSKYVSKIINLENPSTYIRVRLAANVPDEADLLVYYKTVGVGAAHNPETVNWTLFNADTGIIKVQNGNETFNDVDYSIVGLAPFDAVQIKLVMKSTNSSAVPRVKDLRIICCA